MNKLSALDSQIQVKLINIILYIRKHIKIIRELFVKTVSKNNNIFSLTIRSRQLGYSLIEVMIAAFLLSFAILGVTGLQVIGMKGTHQSLMKQQAVGVVQNIVERMRANNSSLSSYEFNSSTISCGGSPANCSASACSAAEIASVDIHNIVCGYGSPSTGGLKITSADDSGILVNGSLKVECQPAGNCTSGDVKITVGWTERELGQETVTPDSLVLTTRIAQ